MLTVSRTKDMRPSEQRKLGRCEELVGTKGWHAAPRAALLVRCETPRCHLTHIVVH